MTKYPAHHQNAIFTFKSERAAKGWCYPLEITSGAIEVSEVHGELFEVQANTSQGLWNLKALRSADVSSDDLRDFLERLEHRRRKRPRHLRWRRNPPSPPILVHTELSKPAAGDTSKISPPSDLVDVQPGGDWRLSPDEILRKLEDPSASHDELFEAVLFAEVAEFDDEQSSRLVPRLFDFVKQHRLSSDDRTKTVTGSAIRRLAMNLPESQYENYADLLAPTDTDTLPCEIELELAKAMLWRLMATPELPQRLPRLKERLNELAMDYLKPRLVLQKNYASVVMHAALGILLLDGEEGNRIVSRIQVLGIGWFTDLFLRRLRRLHATLIERHDSRLSTICERLSRFESQLQDLSTKG